MTARMPSHRNAAGWQRDEVRRAMSPRSSGGPPASGEIPAASISTTPIESSDDGHVGDRDEQPADEPVEARGHAPAAAGRPARRHATARSSIWTAV